MKKKSEPDTRPVDKELDVARFTRSEMSRGVVGKYAATDGGAVVSVDADVAKDFPTSLAVNTGLRALREIRRIAGVGPVRKAEKSA